MNRMIRLLVMGLVLTFCTDAFAEHGISIEGFQEYRRKSLANNMALAGASDSLISLVFTLPLATVIDTETAKQTRNTWLWISLDGKLAIIFYDNDSIGMVIYYLPEPELKKK